MNQFERPTSDSAPRRMQLRRVGPWSAAKLSGGLYGGMALLIGVLYGGLAVVGSVIGAIAQEDPTMLAGAVVGVVLAVVLPFLYGFIGGMAGMVGAALYNFVAGRLGGLEFELEAV